MFCFGVFSYSRTSVERIRRAVIMPFVSQGLQTRDIDACVILDFKANTANKVLILCSSAFYEVSLKVTAREKRTVGLNYSYSVIA